MSLKGCVYILSNKSRSTIYISVTKDLRARLRTHRETTSPSFVSRYKLFDLIYYEVAPTLIDAIKREKQLKRWHREWKFNLIKKVNPTLRDLTDELSLID